MITEESKLPKHPNCAICYLEYDTAFFRHTPCVLDCGHSLCGYCLFKVPGTKCPTCRTIVLFSKTRVNFALIEMVDQFKALSPIVMEAPPLQALCVADHPDQQMFCIKCFDEYCAKCNSEPHQNHENCKSHEGKKDLLHALLKIKGFYLGTNIDDPRKGIVADAKEVISKMKSVIDYTNEKSPEFLDANKLREEMLSQTNVGAEAEAALKAPLSNTLALHDLNSKIKKLIASEEFKNLNLPATRSSKPPISLVDLEMAEELGIRGMFQDLNDARLGMDDDVNELEIRMDRVEPFEFSEWPMMPPMLPFFDIEMDLPRRAGRRFGRSYRDFLHLHRRNHIDRMALNEPADPVLIVPQPDPPEPQEEGRGRSRVRSRPRQESTQGDAPQEPEENPARSSRRRTSEPRETDRVSRRTRSRRHNDS